MSLPEIKHHSDNKYKIITLGLLVHVLLLLAVFDVYFSSPLDHGMTPQKSTYNPPAKRLVLLVADGLRAEAIYREEEEILIPFLSQRKKTGSWGVAHTRVPTESRPGHVAILAGIYEDPSAILKGWKANPVSFDSVISESVNAWCWGSPDILKLFNGDNSPSVHLYMYGSEMEDFGKNNTGLLDTWVYNKVEQFSREVQTCTEETCERYFGKGNLFFLHLLGIDTAGHGYKPRSKEYLDNIKLVDEIAKRVEELFKATFKDDSTAFVFTADHGMTDWGSHGSGSRHETEVPIIAWGAGIKVNERRRDVYQIDIAPLLSSLIGINIPVNSLGILPNDYLDMSDSDLSKVMLSNTLQLLKIFNVKRQRTESNAIVYVPFKGFTTYSLEAKLTDLGDLENNQRFKELMRECAEFMQLLIEGINYYHNYYQYPVLFAVSLGFFEWIVFLSISVFFYGKSNAPSNVFDKSVFVACVLIVLLLCFKHKFPFTYYLYFSFPVAMYFISLKHLNIVTVFRNTSKIIAKQAVFNIIFYLIGIELLIYGFFDRLAFTFLMILVGLWVFFSESLNRNTTRKEKYVWFFCCLVLAVFPALPVMKTAFNIPLYVCGTVGWILLFKEMYINKFKVYYAGEVTAQYKPFCVQFCCLVLAAFYVLLLDQEVISSDSNVKYISWLFLVLPILMIPLTSTFIAVRLIATFFAFAPFYLLVSPNYEVLFSAFYVALLCTWLLIESKSFHFGNISNVVYYVKFENYKSRNKIGSDVFRRAFLFMVFIFLGFFGTGNIASLNSFDPMWVRAFLTVFSPFKMTGLILLKLMVPFIFTCCVFRAINAVGKENVLNTFCIILIFSDIMVLQFLYLITNVGSWLDIGTSLSHFIIMEAFVTILLLLYGLAHVLTTVKY